jgi:TM2 domain-containing membrane protein YozV
MAYSAQTNGDGLSFCSRCGKEIPMDAAFCPECGAPVEGQARDPGQPEEDVTGGRVNVGAAVVLSVVFPGLGQIYAGEKRRGTAFVVAGLILLGTFFIEIGLILYPVFLLISVFDAYRSARRINDVNDLAAAVPSENKRVLLRGTFDARSERES